MSQYTKNNPYNLSIKDRYPLFKERSTRETFHVVLNNRQQALSFEAGDSIGIFPPNNLSTVKQLIHLLNADPNQLITAPKSDAQITFYEYLLKYANLQKMRPSLLKEIADRSNNSYLKQLYLPGKQRQLSQMLGDFDILQWIKNFKNCIQPADIAGKLLPLMPRYYSIASSPHVHKNEIHLTVACFTYFQESEKKRGLGSDFLCYHAKINETPIPAFIQPSKNFKLPQDFSRDIIMIGPGTGVAPYKAFIEERLHIGATGKNWLFFGERNEKTDFFYQNFLTSWHDNGHLLLDLAFSRDQKDKIYVQHRMMEKAKQIYSWLDKGAFLYICGDAKRMAKDVTQTLTQIICQEKCCNMEEAKVYVKNLRKSKRLQLDVY